MTEERVPVTDYMHTHPNCRCVMVPKTKSWEELGFPGVAQMLRDGALDAAEPSMTGEEALARMPKATQRSILGPSRWRLWSGARGRRGVPDGLGLSLSQMVEDRYDPRWGYGLRLTRLDTLLAQMEQDPALRALAQSVRVMPKAKGRRTWRETPVDYSEIPVRLRMERLEETERVHREEYAFAAALDGMTVDQAIAATNENLAKELSPKRVELRIGMPEAAFAGFLRDGRYKNQFETGTSTGVFDPSMRAALEARTYPSWRYDNPSIWVSIPVHNSGRFRPAYEG